MTKKEIEDQIASLKSDYIRIQGDMDKLEANGVNVQNAEAQLEKIEVEMKELRKELAEVKS
ncbi:hypothetical protein LCL89_15215 [Halobacillus yeomjeoni]|uniref:SE1832 family protein n=1 Tax=Halobacillus yeomjeoni TaxID=311194 RepID=UPI001CD35661|nr:SE1832 family protein [Halobacillus yeomjeoni]MCA0985383.1 hypothetical protein [Halobacillus yeomjeoni]